MTKGELINLLLAEPSPLDTKIFVIGHSKGIHDEINEVYTDTDISPDNRRNPAIFETFIVISN